MEDTNINKKNLDFELKDNNNRNKKTVKRVIKTYRDFAVNALNDKPTSLAQMIIKEKKKREKAEKKTIKNPKNMAMIVLSSILVFLGVVAIASIVIFINTKSDSIDSRKFDDIASSSIKFDWRTVVVLNNKSDIKDAVNELFDSTSLPNNTIKNIIFVKEDENGYQRQVSSKTFLSKLETRVPNQFIRNLNDRFSVGVVFIGEPKPFMILETKSEDTANLNLIAWERTMLYDMGKYFKVNQKYYAKQFKDIILFNKDVKAVLDNQGNLVFGYSIIDSEKIVFFTDSQVFKHIISNLKKIIKK